MACAPFTSRRGHRGAALLMREVGSWLVPPGSDPDTPGGARGSSSRTWRGCTRPTGASGTTSSLFPLAHHYVFLTPTMARLELAAGGQDPVPPAVAAGWRELAAGHPAEARLLGRSGRGSRSAARRPRPRPQHPHPRRLEAGQPGRPPRRQNHPPRLGPLRGRATARRPRLVPRGQLRPSPRIQGGDHRPLPSRARGLRRRDLRWWDEQLAAALVGAFLQLGWSKTADQSEFEWWAGRAVESGWLR